jgi:nitrogen regulatory protein P-II 1
MLQVGLSTRARNAVETRQKRARGDDGMVKKIEAIIKPFKLDEVKLALGDIAVQGMTITDVQGVGRTGGKREIYRGSAYASDFIPKVMIEIIASDEMVQSIIATIGKVTNTGRIGDGKIFVTSIDDVVRVRTGETGEDAI